MSEEIRVCPICMKRPHVWYERAQYGSRELHWIGCKTDVKLLVGALSRPVAVSLWERLVNRTRYELAHR